MGNKKMENISTVKVNAYEIAKAPDIDFGYKSILDHFSIFIDRMFNYHTPEITDKLFFDSAMIGKDRKDFIIGGGLVVAGDAMLRPLPIVAFSNIGGLFITNGLDVDNRPYQIPLGDDFTVEGYRIESIYIGNAEKDESIYGGGGTDEKKKDPSWDEYESEWRAAYQVGKSGIDTPFREFKKRQMQAVRFYVYPGVIELEKDKAIAAATPTDNDVFNKRVKIAEVLVHCTVDSGNMPHIQPIQPDDVRFVTATQYWEDNEQQSAEDADSQWLMFATQSTPNIVAGMTREQRKAEEERVRRLNAGRRAFRAEHYNYRWTADITRTYRLGSVSEISERLYKIHKTDGTLKEAVVWRKHIFLEASNQEALTGADISIDHSTRAPIDLPYNRKIKAGEQINRGLLQLAENLRADWIPVAGKDEKPVTLPYGRKIETEQSVKQGLQKLSDNLRASHIPVEGADIYMPYDIYIKSSESIYTGLERITDVMTKNHDRIAQEEFARAKADAAEAQARRMHEQNTNPHGATSSAIANRLAWRDSNGSMEVKDPISPLGVVNIRYLNSTFKTDVVMKVLQSKYITTQDDFDTWTNQKERNGAYTYVYLKGHFTVHTIVETEKTTKVFDNGVTKEIRQKQIEKRPYGLIMLSGIGTKEVIGIDGATINVKISDSGNIFLNEIFNAGIDGDGDASVTGVTLNVTGRYTYPNRIIGFRHCHCYNCTVNVRGDDGKDGKYDADGVSHDGVKGENGTSAIGFYECYVDKCSATVIGGDGGNGEKGTNGVVGHYDSWSGGNGGAGGDAYSGYQCTLSNEGFINQDINGGDGGKCGKCGRPKYSWGIHGVAGQHGKHGKGGDVYVYLRFYYKYKAGTSWLGFTDWFDKGEDYHERSTPDGILGSVKWL